MKSIGFAVLLSIVLVSAPSLFAKMSVSQAVSSEPVILDKSINVISPAIQERVDKTISDTIKIWVFFTDKGVFSQAEFDQIAGLININEHTARRRAKVGLDRIVFADLPVKREYIDMIRDLGADYRRTSKWLNAASFEVAGDILERIADLDFVHSIQSIGHYKRTIIDENVPEFKFDMLDKSPTEFFNYGASLNQISQINVDELHELGYSGQGLIVGMFDSGFRKSHISFVNIINEGRLLAEYDFINNDYNVQNEGADISSQHEHGTKTWSVLGGFTQGQLIGPAYGASFLLAKTEDMTDEYPGEEDNWQAAMEWADSLGVDVISSSLGYYDWYEFSDMDGLTAPITIAANIATSMGILVCNAMGNRGSLGDGSLITPADAFDIISCGAVDDSGYIASFSSLGPTYDGRTKPEVCAGGVTCRIAKGTGDLIFTYGSGTSYSTPLIAGAAAMLMSALPDYSPQQIREALMMTADNAGTPDNTYGWGIINALDAYNWGANFYADNTLGYENLTVTFRDSSSIPTTGLKLYFGDGDSSMVLEAIHEYSEPGEYDVTIIVETAQGSYTRTKEDYIAVIADTLSFISDSGYAGNMAVVSINLNNSQTLNEITIPVLYGLDFEYTLDSVTSGNRTLDFESLTELYHTSETGELLFKMTASSCGTVSLLESGTGEIARLYFTLDSLAPEGVSASLNTSVIMGEGIMLGNNKRSYTPEVLAGILTVNSVAVGDVDDDGLMNLADILNLITYVYLEGTPPVSLASGDIIIDQVIDLLDILELIDIIYGERL